MLKKNYKKATPHKRQHSINHFRIIAEAASSDLRGNLQSFGKENHFRRHINSKTIIFKATIFNIESFWRRRHVRSHFRSFSKQLPSIFEATSHHCPSNCESFWKNHFGSRFESFSKGKIQPKELQNREHSFILKLSENSEATY